MSKTWFSFKIEWYEALKDCEPSIRLEIFDAIMEYAFNGEIPELSQLAGMAFKFIKKDIDENMRKYQELCKKRKEAINKRWHGNSNTNEYNCIQMNTSEYKPIQTHTNDTNNNVDINIYDNNLNNNKNHSINRVSKKEVEQKHHYAPCVMLTESEYGKLVEAHGEDGAAWMVKKLDDYKAASGRTYKSDYRAILNWVVGEYRKHVAEQITGAYGDSGSVESNQDRERRKRNEEFQRHIERKLRGLEQ